MDDAKKRLEETRERLGEWRERLSKRLDDFQRKRELFAEVEARRASRAPTLPLDDPDAASEPPPAAEPLAARRASLSPGERARLEQAPTAPVAADDAEAAAAPLDEQDPLGITAPERRAEAATPSGRFAMPVLTVPEPGVAPTDPFFDEPRREPEAASEPGFPATLARRAAALLLDLLLLLVLPSALLTLPACWLLLDESASGLWGEHAELLVPFGACLFVLLVASYTGAYGRTPGLRMVGLRVVDETGQIPSFGRALLRAFSFPIVLLPGVEAASRTRTVAEP